MKTRIPLAAILVFLLVGEAGAQSRPPPEQSSAEQNQRTEGERRAADQAPTEVLPVSADETRADEEQRERLRQSINEGRMVFLTFAITVFAGLQALFAFITLRGLRYARRSAEAAEINIKTIQETSKAQLRPYVYVTDAVVTEVKGSGPIKLVVLAKNGGATPAYDVTHQIGTRFRPPEHADFSLPSNIPLSRTTVGPDGANRMDHEIEREIWNAAVGGLIDGTMTLFLVGEIKYRDTFGENHVTRYRFRLPTKGGARDGNFLVCAEGNEAT